MTDDNRSADVFRLTVSADAPLSQRLTGALAIPVMDRLLGLKRCREIYGTIRDQPPETFADAALAALGVKWDLESAELVKIPAHGPLVVVANHPFGAVEGLMIIALLRRVRPDIKVMANYLLQRIPQLAKQVIAVDPFGASQSARRNIGPLRDSLRWLGQGGVLVVFPAGEVSHFKPSHRAVADPTWSDTLGRIVRRSKAGVLPIFFPGCNGLKFQLAGMVHPRLRTALLARELLNKRGRSLSARIGALISARQLSQLGTDREVVDYLRLRTYMLGCTPQSQPSRPVAEAETKEDAEPPMAVIAPQDSKLLVAEVSRLDVTGLLAENKTLQVWQAEAAQIPYLLLEIGRLREITFRAIGEGTGRPFDLDRFDQHYLHIFLWHKQRQEVVGAYRLGRCDRILQQQGKSGLYTSTLFKYRSKLFDRLGPALELGRSFVRPEYQRSYTPLLLLWKGIGAFVVANPQYRTLFGPVSISRDYSDLSRRLIAGSLRETLLAPNLAGLVKPRVPLDSRPVRVKGCAADLAHTFCSNIDQVGAMVADIDVEQKGIPVLLRHYLNLGGKLLAFNVDREFSDVLDGLILVDLTETERKTLERYFGKEGTEAFLNYQCMMKMQPRALCA
jgi:putative hemolysin